MSDRLTVNIMTAVLSPGDAIGNYIVTKVRLLREMGCRVRLYADAIHPEFPLMARQTKWYVSTGASVLWYHYSIYTPNVAIAQASADFKIMDYHGISPPELFSAWDTHLADLCARGRALLPALCCDFNYYVVHSDYARQELMAHGYEASLITKLPLCVDLTRLRPLAEDSALVALLAQTPYLLFVGRIVPQKDIGRLLEIFGLVYQQRPDLKLILVGSREQLPGYQAQLEALVAAAGLQDAVLFTGQINEAAVLATIISQAQYLVVVSEWESFCVPVVEALAFGVPSIVHDLPPLPEVGGPAAVVIDKHQPGMAAQRIIALLENPAKRQRLQTAAYEQAQQFTDDALRQVLQRFWEEIKNGFKRMAQKTAKSVKSA